MKDACHVMIDIETTGKRPGCKVLAIGAFAFNPSFGPAMMSRFQIILDVEGWDPSYKDDPSTVQWWLSQPNETYMLNWTGVTPPRDGLMLFRAWMKDQAPQFIWCKGASFDFPILDYALDDILGEGVSDQVMPYRSRMCMRSLPHLYPHIKQVASREAHSALDDAVAQGHYVLDVLRSAGGYSIGQRVRKVTGDYQIEGEVRGSFKLYDGGPTRYVVSHEAKPAGYFAHIYSGAQLEEVDHHD